MPGYYGFRRWSRFSRFGFKKIDFWSVIGVLMVCAAAYGGAYLLGGLYLDILREGAADRSRLPAVEETEPVHVGEQEKSVTLDPVPVYYLQAGVYSSPEGAQAAARPLEEAGFMPYITKNVPHRVWIGIYRKRSDAEAVKQRLLEKGISSFTGSTVLNSSDLKYGGSNEMFVQSMLPFLEVSTDWLKANLEVFQSDRADGLDWEAVEGHALMAREIHRSLLEVQNQIHTNSEAVNLLAAELAAAADAFLEQLETLMQTKAQDDLDRLRNSYLLFVDNFILLRQEIENMSKT